MTSRTRPLGRRWPSRSRDPRSGPALRPSARRRGLVAARQRGLVPGLFRYVTVRCSAATEPSNDSIRSTASAASRHRASRPHRLVRSGLQPFKLATRVRIPLGTPWFAGRRPRIHNEILGGRTRRDTTTAWLRIPLGPPLPTHSFAASPSTRIGSRVFRPRHLSATQGALRRGRSARSSRLARRIYRPRHRGTLVAIFPLEHRESR